MLAPYNIDNLNVWVLYQCGTLIVTHTEFSNHDLGYPSILQRLLDHLLSTQRPNQDTLLEEKN